MVVFDHKYVGPEDVVEVQAVTSEEYHYIQEVPGPFHVVEDLNAMIMNPDSDVTKHSNFYNEEDNGLINAVDHVSLEDTGLTNEVNGHTNVIEYGSVKDTGLLKEDNGLINAVDHESMEDTGLMNEVNGETNDIEYGSVKYTGLLKEDNGLINAVDHGSVEGTGLINKVNGQTNVIEYGSVKDTGLLKDDNGLINAVDHGFMEDTGLINEVNGQTNVIEYGSVKDTGLLKEDNGLINVDDHESVEYAELIKQNNGLTNTVELGGSVEYTEIINDTNCSLAKEYELKKASNSYFKKDHSSIELSNGNLVEDSTKIGHCDTVEGHGMIVAAHYNALAALAEQGLSERSKSRIMHLRNFNNWVKNTLINEYMDLIKQDKLDGSPMRVMDMCCGKGGDLQKWCSTDINHLVCADFAETSVELYKIRYEKIRQQREGCYQQLFTAEFYVADLSKVNLREKCKDVSLELDLVSCQFAFHYCFESLPQTECMLRNAAESLRPGGFFIGTIPDSNNIVKRFRENGSKPFGNKVYSIEFEKSEEPFPLFGAKYNFSLMDVVNCPEFLVHFPTLERLARKHGLELIEKERFDNYFLIHEEKGRDLLGTMQALECYPAFEGVSLHGEEEEYLHAKEFTEPNGGEHVGTMSKSEWEAISLYMVFAFRKLKRVSCDAEGRSVYEQPQAKKETVKMTVEKPMRTETYSSKRLKGNCTMCCQYC